MLDREVKFENLKEMLQKSVEKFGDEAAFYLDGTNIEDSKKNNI